MKSLENNHITPIQEYPQMVLRKLFIALIFTMFVGGGVALPVSVDTTDGVRLAAQSAQAKSHKEKKAKKEKRENVCFFGKCLFKIF